MWCAHLIQWPRWILLEVFGRMVEASLRWSFSPWLQFEIFKILNVEQQAMPRRTCDIICDWVVLCHRAAMFLLALEKTEQNFKNIWLMGLTNRNGKFMWCLVLHDASSIIFSQYFGLNIPLPASPYTENIGHESWMKLTRGFSKEDGSLSKTTGSAITTRYLLDRSGLNKSKHTSSNNTSKYIPHEIHEKYPTVVYTKSWYNSQVVYTKYCFPIFPHRWKRLTSSVEVCLLNSRHWSRTRGGGLGYLAASCGKMKFEGLNHSFPLVRP